MPIRTLLAGAVCALAALLPVSAATADRGGESALWRAYDQTLSRARYIDPTHTLTPRAPGGRGFGPWVLNPAVAPATGTPYSYAKGGFEPPSYELSTDLFGTQLDPPAHWAPEYPG